MHVCVCVYVHSVCGMVYVVCVCVCGVCDECVWYVWCVCMACPCVRCVWFDVVCMCVCGVCDVCMVEHEETSLRRTLEDKQGSLGWEWRGLAGREGPNNPAEEPAGGGVSGSCDGW